MKTLIIINEPFEKMAFGTNTTLAYITAAFDLGHEVYIYDLSQSGKIDESIKCLKIEEKEGNLLARNYKASNQAIVQNINKPKITVSYVTKINEFETIKLQHIDLILQRLEPMKFPFPPQGNRKVDDVLKEIKNALSPKKIFNCPIGLGDKEIIQEINSILKNQAKEPIAIATKVIKLDDENFSKSFNKMGEEYQNLYKRSHKKLVLKPNNSAQSLGVFALEFDDQGFDLSSLKSQKISHLANSQIYKIKDNLNETDLKEIVEILCFVQRSENSENIVFNLSRDEIIKKAKELYNEEILVQPFLEGVKFGDVRLNYLKNKKGDFYLAGGVFRSSLRKENDGNFTTAFITGGAASKTLSNLSKAEEQDLFKKSQEILKILNKDLRERYKNTTEFGADFILVGDGKKVLLGEINHHCQGLIPVGEAMEKMLNNDAKYDGGLALVKDAILDLADLNGLNG